MRTVLLLCCIAPALLLARGRVCADIGPNPIQRGQTPAAQGAEEPVGVRMLAEDVQLVLTGKDEARTSVELIVTATFEMQNPGASLEMETGFPAGDRGTLEDFFVTVDGEAVEVVLLRRDEPATDDDEESPASDPERAPEDWWYVWTAPYPGGTTSTHVVTYRLPVQRNSSLGHTGYVLHTGAPWDGTIGKARITLRTAGTLRLDHLYDVRPHPGGRRTDSSIVWEFEDLEPTTEHDIHIGWIEHAWSDQRRELESRAVREWAARRELAMLLRAWPERNLRRRHDRTEAEAWLEALASILAERKVEGDSVVLPLRDPGAERPRSYVSNPASLFYMLPSVFDAVEALPEDHERAAEVRAMWLETFDAWREGRLHVDDRPLPVPTSGTAAIFARRIIERIQARR